MAFSTPSYDAFAIGFAALGAAISYGRMSKAAVKTIVLSAVFDFFFKESPGSKWRLFLEFLVFVGLGVIIGVGITQPTNAMQALTAGIGWTALIAKQPK